MTTEHPENWILPGARQDAQSITADWRPVDGDLIDGVRVREAANVMTGYGRLTELWRSDWALDTGPVDQVFASHLGPGALSAWHAHGRTIDRITVTAGQMMIVLYDARGDSPTHGRVDRFRIGEHRPTLLVIPPGVWHGVLNTHHETATLVNIVDRAYSYEGPDHWRLPWDSPEIPFSWAPYDPRLDDRSRHD